MELTPTVRRYIYFVLAVAGLIVSSLNVGYSSIEHENPSWLIVCTAVYGFLASPAGILALLNTKQDQEQP